METKYCSKCKEHKPISEFYKNNRGGCKKCIRAYQAKYYAYNYATPVKSKLPDGLKRCSKCHQIKSILDYYQDKSSKTGYQHKCKACSNIARKQRNQKYLKPKEVLPDGFKKCSKCKRILEIDKFNKIHGKLRSRCKDCEKEYKIVNREKLRLAERNRRNKPEVREAIVLRKREFNKRIRLDPDRLAKELKYRKTYRQREEVKEKNREHNRNYLSRPENQAKARAETIKWRKENPDKANLQRNIKRVRKLNAKGSHTVDQWQALKSFFDRCPKCNQDLPLTRDHIIPLSKGGSDYIDNIQPLCRSCNSSKNDGFAVDYRPNLVRYWALDEMAKTY